MRKRKTEWWGRRSRLGVAAALVCVGLAGCADGWGAPDHCDNGLRDWEQETFGVALPTPGPVDLSRLPLSVIEPHYQGPFRMVANLARGDFAAVQAHWQSVDAINDPTERMRAVVRSLDAVSGRGLALLHQAQAWQAREPDSPAAQLLLAAAFAHAGHEVSHQAWHPATTFARFRRLDGRMGSAAQWIDPLLQRDDVYGLAAKELNLGVRFVLGDTDFEQAWNQYLNLLEVAPHYEWIYLRAVNWAAPRHSEGAAQRRLADLQRLAAEKGLPQVHQVTLRQSIEALAKPPDKEPNPQAWRPYWEARVAAAPTITNLVGWMGAEQAVSNWPRLLELSERIIAMHPHHLNAWEMKSWALVNMGRLEASYDAAMVAIVLGSDWAMNRVVQGYVRGEMGLPHGDHQALLAHCQLGAAMALAAAANCLGSSYTDGFAGVQRDQKAALAWHFLGARGGHFNSQHDVAVLLPKVVTDPALAQDIDHAAGHWLRRAWSKTHRAATNKLEARPDWGKVCAPVNRELMWRTLYGVLKSIFL